MRIALLSLILSLSFCLCNGTSRKEVGTSSNPRSRTAFSEIEDKFIVDELLRLTEDSVPARILGKNLWESIHENHRKKWMENTFGFPCERALDTLRRRFTKTLLRNPTQSKVKVPETFFRRFSSLIEHKPKPTGPKYAYTPEETKFIAEELSQPSYTRIHSSSTWETIKTIHDAKRAEGCHGFQHERAAASLRSHMSVMKQRGLLPNEVLEKLPILPTAGSSSRSTPAAETIESLETRNDYEDEDEDEDEDECVDAWLEDLIQEPTDM